MKGFNHCVKIIVVLGQTIFAGASAQQDAKDSFNSRHSNTSGKISREMIVDGERVEPGTYPWFVSFTAVNPFANSSLPILSHFCGGFLIAPEYVLTAAHCGIDNTNAAVVGALCPTSSNNCGQESQIFGIQEVIEHPMFNRNDLQNDFAIVKLDGSSSTDPVKIDNGEYSPNYESDKDNLWAIGKRKNLLGFLNLSFFPRQSICLC